MLKILQNQRKKRAPRLLEKKQVQASNNRSRRLPKRLRESRRQKRRAHPQTPRSSTGRRSSACAPN